MHNVLIIGSNSFSGSVTASRLVSLGVKVIGVNRSNFVPPCYVPQSNDYAKVPIINYSFGSNFSASDIISLCDENEVDLIINFAAQSMVAESWDAPWDWYETNCVWLSRISSAILKWGKLKKFIHFSTPEVYGDTVGWISESNSTNPSTPYAISRLAGDLHLLAEFKRNGFPLIITRAANVYGPYQRRYRLIPKALLAAKNGEVMKLHGGGESLRSFVYMEDVADALYLLIRDGEIGNSYHISTQKLHSVREVVEMCYNVYGADLDEKLETVDDRPGKDSAYKLDSTKIRESLGWRDATSLEDGISATRIWVDSNLDALMSEPKEYVHKP